MKAFPTRACTKFLTFSFYLSLVFDNVDIDDIAKIALEWEQKWGFIRGGDIAARERRWEMGNSLTLLSSERIHELADALCRKAHENSLDSTTDSPFALLAKDNDIMWSGGTFVFHPSLNT
jgi:protein phosphatase PTC7